MRNKFNRQKIDYILSDLLPYEKGNHLTNKYLYEYILNHKKEYNNLLKIVKTSSSNFDSKWHSVPLKFKVKKKDEKFREISLINPLGLIESLIFIDIFEYDILNIIQNRSFFSLRTPHRINSLSYKKDKNQVVYYSNDKEKKQLLISLESSGSYFKHKPFKRITQFYNSGTFNFSQDKFENLVRIDIQDCFSSIYTHSYKWLISNKTYDSKSLKNANSIYRNLDTFLQNLNGSKTNGILVGPEIMRLSAEFLFVHLDQKILENLTRIGLETDQHFRIFRFVDDYFIFTNNKETELEIIKTIREVLNKYHLKINDTKLKSFDNNISFNKWKYETEMLVPKLEEIVHENSGKKKSMELIEQLNFNDNQLKFIKTIDSLFQSKNRKIKYSDIRNEYLILLEETKEKELVTSFLLSVILNRLENLNKNDVELGMQDNDLITFIFLLYSVDINYTSTQKTIRILTLLLDKFNKDVTSSIERSLERFGDKIFNAFNSDWIDLLLFIAIYDIEIPENKLIDLTDRVIKDDNPVLLAALCIFFIKKNRTRKINSKLNKILEEKIRRINWTYMFEDKEIWWILIFYSYPKLSKTLKKNMTDKLMEYIRGINGKDHAVYLSQKLILQFILNENIHFIEWGFVKSDYYREYFFYTRDRTVFNPGIVNQISLSR